jgi:hypothetical protein
LGQDGWLSSHGSHWFDCCLLTADQNQRVPQCGHLMLTHAKTNAARPRSVQPRTTKMVNSDSLVRITRIPRNMMFPLMTSVTMEAMSFHHWPVRRITDELNTAPPRAVQREFDCRNETGKGCEGCGPCRPRPGRRRLATLDPPSRSPHRFDRQRVAIGCSRRSVCPIGKRCAGAAAGPSCVRLMRLRAPRPPAGSVPEYRSTVPRWPL